MTALFIAVLSTVLTNLITGQPLVGLTKLKGLSQTFFKSSAPAWVFALVLFLALLGLYSFLRTFLKNRKGRVHFVPDAHNCGWAQSNGLMHVSVSGSFTYEGEGSLTILKAFLKGTEPVTDMMVQQVVDGLTSPLNLRELNLEAHIPVRALVFLRLKPGRGIQGKTLNGRLVFRDKYNQDFGFEISLPYQR